VGNASIVTGEEGVSDGFDPATGATSQIDTLFRRVVVCVPVTGVSGRQLYGRVLLSAR
jgi:N-acetylglutamate synthase/N-acetylornithine aminotransferase